MIKRRKHKPMGLRSSARIRCPAHLKWVRGHVCVIAEWHFCSPRIEAAHVRTGTDGGTGVKPSDEWTLPMCSDAHKIQHDIGEREFERRYNIDLKEKARLYWDRSPARIKLEKSGSGPRCDNLGERNRM